MSDKKQKYLPGWSEVAPKRGSRLYTQEDLARRYGQRKPGIKGWDDRAAKALANTGQPRIVYHGAPKAVGGAVWQQPKDARKRKPGRPRKAKRILYIAYGSNLHKRSMWQRCPGAIYRGRITLDNARLVFRGVADVMPEKGSQCPAGVWEITEDDERRLDSYEGVESGTYSKHFVPVGKGWGHKEALIYLMNDDGIYPPTAWYAGIIRRGYRDFKLDEGYLDAAIKYAYTDKNPSAQTRRRRVRQLKGDVQRRLVEVPEEVAEAHRARMRELAEQERIEARQQLNGEYRQLFDDVMLPKNYD